MKQAKTIPAELQTPVLFDQDELVFYQDPFTDEQRDESGVRVVVYSPSQDDISEAVYHVRDLSNTLSKVHHHELRPIDKAETDAWYNEAEKHCETPFEKGDVVIWEDPARDPSEWGLYRVAVTPDVRTFAPDEILIWPELICDQEFLINAPDGSEAGVYPHEIRKPTEEEMTAYYIRCGGSRCPHCLDDIIEGDSIEIDGNQALQSVSCNNCNATWTDCYTLSNRAIVSVGDSD